MSSCTKVSKKLSVCHGSNFSSLGCRSGRQSSDMKLAKVGQSRGCGKLIDQSKLFQTEQ